LIGHDNSGDPLGRRVFRGSVWLLGPYGLSKIARMAIMLIIAALLSPREYGAINLCSIFIFIGETITEFGIWQAVVYRKEPDEHFLNTAFTANVLGGFVTAAGLFLAAPWIALFYAEPEITNVLRVMGLGLIADAIFYVPDGLLRKKLRFKSRALAEIGSAFGAAVTTIALLLLGVGVLSFGVGYVAEKTVRCALIIVITRWWPIFRIHWASLREIAFYAKHILGSEVARQVASNIDFLIVGHILGAGPLGFYTLAFNLSNYPVTNFVIILSRISFPTFAILQENPDYARRVYLKMVQIISGLVIPLLVMLAVLAPLVVGLLGERWQPAVFPMQVMVVAGIFRGISVPGSDMLRANGFPNVPFKVNLVESLVLAGAVLLVAARGIEVIALSVVAVLSLSSWATMLITCRVFGISLWELGWALLPGVVLAASGAAAVFSLELLDLSALPNALELALLVAAASGGMVVCMVTVLRSFFHEIVVFATSRKLE